MPAVKRVSHPKGEWECGLGITTLCLFPNRITLYGSVDVPHTELRITLLSIWYGLVVEARGFRLGVDAAPMTFPVAGIRYSNVGR